MKENIIQKPNKEDVSSYYWTYITKVDENDLFVALENDLGYCISILQKFADKADFRYAPGKWSVKEVLAHIIDSERIFVYRALRYSRLDSTPLSGYDENFYAPNANADNRELSDMILEFYGVRKSTIDFFKSLDLPMFDRIGTANNTQLSVRAIGFIVAGHANHHINVIKERY